MKQIARTLRIERDGFHFTLDNDMITVQDTTDPRDGVTFVMHRGQWNNIRSGIDTLIAQFDRVAEFVQSK